MPILKSKMKALQKRYGKKEGEDIYNKLEKAGKNQRVKKKPKKNVFK